MRLSIIEQLPISGSWAVQYGPRDHSIALFDHFGLLVDMIISSA